MRGLDVFTLRASKTSTKFRNKNKHYEYHEDFRYTTPKYRELKRVLHELADEG